MQCPNIFRLFPQNRAPSCKLKLLHFPSFNIPGIVEIGEYFKERRFHPNKNTTVEKPCFFGCGSSIW